MKTQFALEELSRTSVHGLIKLLVAIGMFAAFWLAASLAAKFTRRATTAFDERRQIVINLLIQVIYVGLLIFGVITALGTLGINVSALVAGVGLTGFALGFALKDSLSNLLAGVMILLYRPFAHHDHIIVTGLE